MISHRHRFLFVHPLANGGEAIEQAFPGERRRCQQELRSLVFAPGSTTRGRAGGSIWSLTAEDLHHYYAGEVFDRYLKFTVVRNPWDRVAADFLASRPPAKHGSRPELEALREAFRHWLDRSRPKPIDRLLTQRAHLTVDGRSVIDFVARFECLEEDFRSICRLLGLEPRPLAGQPAEGPPAEYTELYDDSTRKKVAELFAEDITEFGYAFGGEPPPAFPLPTQHTARPPNVDRLSNEELIAEVQRLREAARVCAPACVPAPRQRHRAITRREALAAWMTPAFSSLAVLESSRRPEDEDGDRDPRPRPAGA